MKLHSNQPTTKRVWHAITLAWAFIGRLPLFACLALAISAKATIPSSDLPYLGPFGNLAELGNQLEDGQGTINGVGVFTPWKLSFTNSATIGVNGEFYMTGNAGSTGMTVVNGTVFSGQAMSLEQSQLLSDSSALAALTPDQTLIANPATGLNFDVASGEVEVVDLNGGLNLNDQNITLTGGGALVLNIEGSFSLGASAGILGDADNIYINYEGTSPITTGAGATIDGLVFDPNASANLDGTWNGGVYGGWNTITLDPGPGITPVPEPGSMVLISIGLASLLLTRRLCGHHTQYKEN